MRRRRHRAEAHRDGSVDLETRVGSVELASPIMNASGTAGHSTEFADYLELGDLGAFVAKSLCDGPWPGNPAPRVHVTPAGMINSVGLQGPGVEHWLHTDVPALRRSGVKRIVASVWGTDLDAYRRAAGLLAGAPEEIVAIEVNLSCPNTEADRALFAHDPDAAAAVMAGCAAEVDLPLWAKLSPNTDRLVDVAGAAAESGAEAVTLINTLFGMVIDIEARRPVLANGGGGVSGSAVHPIAIRAVYDVHAAWPSLPIVGVGGISSGADAVEFLLAGASAVQIGTAAFADPTILRRVATELEQWCLDHDVSAVAELIGEAHARS